MEGGIPPSAGYTLGARRSPAAILMGYHQAQAARGPQQKGAAGRVFAVSILWSLLHSLLASRAAKHSVQRLVGSQYRNGLYRLIYIVQSLITVSWGTAWFLRQPDRELYHVQQPWSWLLRAVQLSSLAMLFSAIRVVGYRRFFGLEQVHDLLAGNMPDPEPEAQGPPLARNGAIDARGPFQFTRHPDNLPVFGVMWFFPRMTTNRAALAAVFSAYAVLGSLHEDNRLHAAYGKAFERYQRSVPFLLPGWPRE